MAIYLRNIFPDIRMTWGIHPNDIGHTDSRGCFRCHDGSHSSADGQTITNDCSVCHQLLSADEDNSKILKELGLTRHATFGSSENAMLTYDVDFGEPVGVWHAAVLMTFKDGLIANLELFYDARPTEKN
ncbi:MAG: hypothetical protein WAK48_11290 [Candidatus Acidiferrum sp.]|jgi:hypothetical protein